MKEEEKKREEDVEMTDEEEEERIKAEEKGRVRKEQQREVQLSIGEELDKDIINTDLEELIKANGEDIEYEFYYCGQQLIPNQTLFEVLKGCETKKGAYMSSSENNSIYYCIKDKSDEIKKTRKDSIMEFSLKRERTKSEAVDDISVSSIDQLVQQLIDKEFQVFVREQKNQSPDMKYLERALKIIKVLNYLCKNMNLFSN